MKRIGVGVAIALLALAACGPAEQAGDEVLGEVLGEVDHSIEVLDTCVLGDPLCDESAEDFGEFGTVTAVDGEPVTPPVPVQTADGPIVFSYGGFLHSDGENSQLCSALLESDPPQCAATIITVNAPIEDILAELAASQDDADAGINVNDGIYWTNEWVNLRGSLDNGQLILGS